MPSVELGCGPNAKHADVGVDILPGPAVDVVHDLNVMPWPLESSTYERIICIDVLEHLSNVVQVMEEIHRIAVAGASVYIQVPTASSRDFCTDPTHVRGFGYHSFDYFDSSKPLFNSYGYSCIGFAIENVRFVSQRRRWSRSLDTVMWNADKLMCRFANSHPDFYESRLAYIYPMAALRFELKVVK